MAGKKVERTAKFSSGTQEQFFAMLKKVIPPGLGLAEEVSELLNISLDGAYRRLRGETDLTLNEVAVITEKYRISLDEAMGKPGTLASFMYTKLTDSEDNFVSYLTRLYTQLTVINRFDNRKIYYVADDAPLFYSFGRKKLAEFKLFFWQRSVLNIEKYQKEKFSWGMIPENLKWLANESFNEYMKIPSLEVWTDETVLTNIKQIKFYFDSGLLEKEDAIELLGEHRKLIEHVNQMADNGRKNISDDAETFTMYSSEVVLGTNCIYAVMGDLKYSYISFNSVNSLTTGNADFCEETENWLKNLVKKSSLISGIGQAPRYKFFNKMYNTIDQSIADISRA